MLRKKTWLQLLIRGNESCAAFDGGYGDGVGGAAAPYRLLVSCTPEDVISNMTWVSRDSLISYKVHQ